MNKLSPEETSSNLEDVDGDYESFSDDSDSNDDVEYVED